MKSLCCIIEGPSESDAEFPLAGGLIGFGIGLLAGPVALATAAGAAFGASKDPGGGLLFLSRHKIVQANATIYRQTEGEDSHTDKGALHARIHIPGHPCKYDFFLSHTQNLTPKLGSHSKAREALKGQFQQLGAFINVCRDYHQPGLLMGDLNADGIHDLDLYSFMIEALGHPDDLKPVVSPLPGGNDKHPEATNEPEKITSFEKDNPERDKDNQDRFGKDAQRLDYFLSWPGSMFEPKYEGARVVLYQSSQGRDLSDHYGIQVCLDKIEQQLPASSLDINRVSLGLAKFRCVRNTGGLGKDEVKFTLRCVPARGEERSIATPVFGDVEEGLEESLELSALSFNDPGEFLLITVNGKEIGSHPGC